MNLKAVNQSFTTSTPDLKLCQKIGLPRTRAPHLPGPAGEALLLRQRGDHRRLHRQGRAAAARRRQVCPAGRQKFRPDRLSQFALLFRRSPGVSPTKPSLSPTNEAK